MSEQPSNDIALSQPPSESEQPDDDELAFPDLKPGDAWGESITQRRADELEAILQAWEAVEEHGKRRGPFDSDRGVRKGLTGADVFWLVVQEWAGSGNKRSIMSAAVDIRDGQPDQLHDLSSLHLEGALFIRTGESYAVQLHGAYLVGVHMEGADFLAAHLEGANLSRAHLEGANLRWAHLGRAKLNGAHLAGAHLNEARLEGASLSSAHLEEADLSFARMEGARLSDAQLEHAVLADAHLNGAHLQKAHLVGTSLVRVHLESADLAHANLAGADLHGTFFDSGTYLNFVKFDDANAGGVTVRDVRWGDVNLAVVDWTQTRRGILSLRQGIEAIKLGEEREAHRRTGKDGKPKDKATRLQEYKDAVRANRQLATILRQQGLNEDADRFAYKAQKLQRQVLRRQRRYGAALGSWFLDAIAGYGYRPMRSLFTYALVVLAFAVGYYFMRENVHPALNPVDAIIFSITSFHGRGFMPGENVNLHNPLTIAAAIEAIIGLLIEITFIATFTQRFFAR